MDKKIDREAIIAELKREALDDPETGWLSDLARHGLKWEDSDEIISIASWYGSVDVGHLAGVVEHLIAEVTKPLLSRLEQAEARVKLLESGIVADLVITSVHSARAIGATVSGISETLLKLGYGGLTERLEKAEQDRDKLMNRLDAMRRQRDGYRNQLRKTEQQIQRVREMHERIPVVVNGRWEIDHCKFCYEQDFSSDDAVWPCPTIRALDGDGRG